MCRAGGASGSMTDLVRERSPSAPTSTSPSAVLPSANVARTPFGVTSASRSRLPYSMAASRRTAPSRNAAYRSARRTVRPRMPKSANGLPMPLTIRIRDVSMPRSQTASRRSSTRRPSNPFSASVRNAPTPSDPWS